MLQTQQKKAKSLRDSLSRDITMRAVLGCLLLQRYITY